MKQETEIALKAVSGEAQYDRQSKEIWRYKELIAPILRMTVLEFEGMPVGDVIACIEDADITNRKPVDDVSAKFGTAESEQSSITEKLIRYDIHLRARNPKLSTEEILIMLHIDLEIQNEYKPENPAYPITKRAIYYAARELSGQLGILTETTDYRVLEKVYSIWICNEHIPEDLRNSITRFSMKKEVLKGTDREPDEYHDLMDVVIVRRGGEPEDGTIFEYVNAVNFGDMETIKKYTDIEGNQEIRKELGDIMTASQSLVEKGRTEGRAEGLAEGLAEGRAEGGNTMLYSLVADGDLSIAKAAKKAGISEEQFRSNMIACGFKVP